MLKVVRATAAILGLMTAVGCGAQQEGLGDGGSGKSGSGSTAGSGSTGSKAGAGGASADPPVFDNPDEPNGGGGIEIIQIVDNDAGEPSCGASRIGAEQVVVETTVEVPVEVTEEVTELVPETVTEEVTEEITTLKPTVLYIMFDQSASMKNNGLWSPAVAALKSFVSDTNSAGTGVALQYFPINGGKCSDGSGYSVPSVPVGLLPGLATTFKASLDNHSANAIGTPIEGALRGVTEFCKKYQSDHPDEQCVSVLVTDGKPELASGCNENTTTLANIAKSAHDAGVTTFAVGLQGANFTLLNKIAQLGGAPDCDTGSSTYACDVSSNASGLQAALNKIRETVVTTTTHTETHVVTHEVVHEVTHTEVHTEIVQQTQSMTLPCEWAIPAATGGQEFDRNKVNIRLTRDDSQATLVHVKSKDACVANAWIYDNEDQPTRLIACDQTCEQIETAKSAQIDILLGCATLGPG